MGLGNVDNTADASQTALGTVTSGTLSTGAVLGGVTMTLGSDADYDLYFRSGGILTRLAKGTASQVLTMAGDANSFSWANSASGFSDPMTTRGDIIYKNSGGTTTRLGAGTANQILQSDGTDISWATITQTATTDSGTFVSGDLTAGKMDVNHALSFQDVDVWLYDASNIKYAPTNITATDANNCNIDVSGKTITGTHRYVISTGGASISAGGDSSPLTTKGDVYTYTSTNARLAVGTNDHVLTADSGEATGIKWSAIPDQTPLTTKGDLFTYSTVDARLPIGTNDYVLTADSSEATGLKWAASSSGKYGNYSASDSPDTTNDTSESYEVGSAWVDTTADRSYIAVDVTENAAVWNRTSSTAPVVVASGVFYYDSGIVTHNLHNVTSISRDEAGYYSVTLSITMNGTFYPIVVSGSTRSGSSSNYASGCGTRTTTTFKVTRESSSGAGADFSSENPCSFVVYSD